MGGAGNVAVNPQQGQLSQNQSSLMMGSLPQQVNQQQQSPAMNQLIQQQHSILNNPLSNNPGSMIAPNTPQQQLYQQQHLQSGLMSQCSPYSAQSHSNYSQNSNAPLSNIQADQQHLNASTCGPSSVPAPNSVPSSTSAGIQNFQVNFIFNFLNHIFMNKIMHFLA